MNDQVEQPKEKNQWQILSARESEVVGNEISRLRTRQADLIKRLTREAGATIFYTAIEAPLPKWTARETAPDGSNIVNLQPITTPDLTAEPSEETGRIQSELETVAGLLQVNMDQLQALDLLERSSESEKQAWINQAVDRTFRGILAGYPLTTKLVHAAGEERPHRPAQPDNAWPALIALLIYPTLCTADNKDAVLARFVEDNRDNFTLAHGRTAEFMLDRARVFGLIPNSRADRDQQSRDLVGFLHRQQSPQ